MQELQPLSETPLKPDLRLSSAVHSLVTLGLALPTLDCFKPAILAPIKPLWLLDFNLFVKELEANFGTYDPVGRAETKPEGLCMHKSHQATKYFIKFQQLATCVQ